MAITAQMVKELREQTGVGMMDCKKALTETDGDMEKAVEYLRKKGLASAEKKAGRIAAEGVVGAFVCDGCGAGVLVEVNCETDFVAKTDDFKAFVTDIAKHIAQNDPADVEDLKAQAWQGAGTVADYVTGKIAVIGEKIDIRRFVRYKTGNMLETYIHMGGTIGVLLEVEGDGSEAAKVAAHDIAMHIAAANPTSVRREDLPAEEVDKEREIQRAKALSEGKPEQVVEKMIEGRMHKFYAEVCLLEQAFVRDPDITVAEYAKRNGLAIVRFTRYAMGEGIQKRACNFAEEVMAQAKG